MHSQHYDQGILHCDSQHWQLAAKAFEAAVGETPEHAPSHFMLAFCYFRLDQEKKALPVAREASRLDPENAEYHSLVAQILLKMRQYGEAQAEIDEAKRLQPTVAEYHTVDAMISSAQRNYSEALEKINLAWQLDPQSEWAARVKTLVLLNMGNFTEAEKAAVDVLRLDPTGARPNAIMGQIALRRNRHQEALAHFREAARLDPNNNWMQEIFLYEVNKHRHLFSAILRIGSNKPAPPDQGNYHVARFARPATLLVSVLAVVLSLVGHLVWRYPNPGLGVTLSQFEAAIFGGIGLLCAGCAWAMWRTNILWNDEELSGPNVPCTKTHRFKWSELSEIEYLVSSQVYALTGADGNSIYVSDYLQGIEPLRQKIQAELINQELNRASENSDSAARQRLVQHDSFSRNLYVWLGIASIVWLSISPSFVAVAALLTCIIIGWQTFITRVQWNEDTISGRNLFGKTSAFPWTDLKNVKIRKTALEISAQDGSTIYVYSPGFIRGLKELTTKLSTEARKLGLKTALTERR